MVEKLFVGIAAIFAMLSGAAIGAMVGAYLSDGKVEVQAAQIPIAQVARVDQRVTPEQQAPATATPYPTYTPFPTQTPYPTYTAVSTPTGTPLPASTPTPTAVIAVAATAAPRQVLGQVLVVADTGSSGVYIRRTPISSDKITAWSEGTSVIVIGADAQSEGRTWRKVRDPAGNEGWIPSEYLFTPDVAARILSNRR